MVRVLFGDHCLEAALFRVVREITRQTNTDAPYAPRQHAFDRFQYLFGFWFSRNTYDVVRIDQGTNRL